jgi:2-alkenal reductase
MNILQSRTTRTLALIIFGIALLLNVAVFGDVFADEVSPDTGTATAQGGQTFVDVFNRVSPSVVAISIGTGFGGGTGTGFIIDDAGHIMTNNHVVAGAQRIEVEFLDGTLSQASIVGQDPDSDLAVIRVDNPPSTLVPVQFGDSDVLQVGETVLAVGSPFGQDWTLTSGIVSALDRAIAGESRFRIGGVIQTDAAINPGNSGGPLLNINGQVIGVNSQIATRTGSNVGVGFAVPGNLAQRVAGELIADGEVDYSFIGITGSDVTLGLIEEYNLSNDTRGVFLTGVERNSPAAQAGLQAVDLNNLNANELPNSLDIITAVNGVNITGFDDLISYLVKNTRPGDTITLSIVRTEGSVFDVPVTLASRPAFD